jgi:uncharacterized peroxidase-related enzyme
VAKDWRSVSLSAGDALLCEYAEKLTLRPGEMKPDDVDRLRSAGFDDLAIHDAIQVVSYFNYINRVADAVHVDVEPDMDPYPGES